MKELEKMYDIIFEDKELKKLFLNFHSCNWENLDVDDKVELIEKINDRVASLYSFTPCKIVEIKGKNYGSHNSFNWKIAINPESLKDDNGYETIDTYFHELRHSFQHRSIENRLEKNESVSVENKKLWNKNFTPGNYFGGDSDYYQYQYVERDAWSVGMLFARKVYLLNKEQIKQEDKEWETYCKLHRNVIVDFISENEDSKDKLARIDKQIEKIYDSKMDDLEQINKGKAYVKEILAKKEIKDLSFKEVALLLSPYSFSYLNITDKIKVFNKYYEYVKIGNRNLKIEENTIGSIKCGNHLYYTNDSLTIVNSILSYNFQRISKAICDNKQLTYPLSKKAIREIKLNMYVDSNKKKINYISDNDNLFLFSLQPYARYESYYVLKELSRLRKIELEYFSKNSSEWGYWDNFYDNKLIFKTASKLMGEPFKDYYNRQLSIYKDRINEDKKRKKV